MIKRCCNCDDGKFVNDLFGKSEYICKKKNKKVNYSGNCVYGLSQKKNVVRIK